MERIEDTSNKQLTYAGFWLRFAAYILDRLALSVASLFFVIPFLLVFATASELSAIETLEELMISENLLRFTLAIGSLFLLFLFSLPVKWLYYSLMESSKFQGTLGKLALGIKVTDYEGNRISFGKATGRYFSRIITNMTMFIGYILAGFTVRKQALHDMIASCIVVKK